MNKCIPNLNTMKNVSLIFLIKKYTHFIDNLFKSLSSPTLMIKVMIIINTIKGQVKYEIY